MGRFVILSGPSCVGKGPLCAALKRHHPDAAAGLKRLILYNDRAPRPIETDGVDYHFRPRREIERLSEQGNFLVMEARGDFQAADLEELERMLASGDAFFEGNPFVAHALLTSGLASRTHVLSVFLSPLSREEVERLREPECGITLEDFLTDVMRRKLRRRTVRQKGALTEVDLEEIERRASSACAELGFAHHFQHVIPNHDGEDSENWDVLPYPAGDAGRALRAFAELLAGRVPAVAETWEEGKPL